MRIHVIIHKDGNGDVDDVLYFCGEYCMEGILRECGTQFISGRAGENDKLSWGSWPGGNETGYDVYCGFCDTLLWRGMNQEEEDCVWNSQLIERYT